MNSRIFSLVKTAGKVSLPFLVIVYHRIQKSNEKNERGAKIDAYRCQK
jgi:hypothetical protein